MTKSATPFTISIVVLLLLQGARPAYAIDVTGEWQIRYSCRSFADGFFSERLGPGGVDITQTGIDLNIRENGAILFSGVITDDPNSSARAAVAARECGIDHTFALSGTLVHLKFIVPSDGRAIARGWQIVNCDDTTSLCKVRLEREITTNPNVLACP
jgi:hypothetical protein